jgi:hypothetical protein
MSIGSIIVGALAGLIVTVLVTYLWPKGKNRHLGAITGALLGFGLAYLVMTQVQL